MENRALLAVVLSLLILLVYQAFVLPHFYPNAMNPTHPATVADRGEKDAPPPSTGEPAAPPDLAQAANETAAPERLVTVETDRFVAVVTSIGGRLKSYQLKQYRTTVDPQSSYQELIVPTADGEFPFGVELRGTRGGASSAEGSRADLVTNSDTAASYVIDAPSTIRLSGAETGAVQLSWQGAQGTIRKRLEFNGDRYEFSAQISASGVPAPYRELGVTWEVPRDGKAPGSHELLFDHAIYLVNGKSSSLQFHSSDLVEGTAFPEPGVKEEADISWTAISGRHFLAALMPLNTTDSRLWLKERDATVQAKLLFPITDGSVQRDLELYVGPKEVAALENAGHQLERTIDLGWFSFIGFGLLWALRMSHKLTHNFGVDIILLTVIIKILFLPLTQKSMETMRAMQKLQPQIARLREQYKDDQEAMNKEMMELYQRHKVNPFGGCVPMLLQFPVFIGLYQALMNAIELRHSPFMLWIDDLSAPDRLGSLQLPFVDQPGIPVLTVFMGASMLAQQWMTPPAGDPAQQRVMMLMPLLFTFVFVNFPSGLVLYWLVNNVLTIAQQYYITRPTAKA